MYNTILINRLYKYKYLLLSNQDTKKSIHSLDCNKLHLYQQSRTTSQIFYKLLHLIQSAWIYDFQ